ncbi:endochitinase A [Drosophila mauritiana]|uniref:Endochitinase A n=1 Tax=Drosophila mauritiana TaxID=7226 RepID=A0A6P8KQT2_DROMA|nr:endochitinase A [Drosophila mauritiana]
MMSFTISLALLLLAVLILGILFACHCLGPRAANWMRMRSSKEEKIGLSNHKQKLFHANGYMASIQSGSEFLLSTSGSFKRFDTIDKEDYNRSQQTHQTHLFLMNGGGAVSITGSSSALQATTAMWHLPRSGIKIPPPPDRPAPSPNSAAAAGKTVTFSLTQVNEVTTPGEQVTSNDQERRSCLRQNGGTANGAGGGGVLPQPLEAPPPPRLTASTSVNLSGTAIPRPIAKRQVSLQPATNGGGQAEQPVVTPTREGERKAPALKRRNSSTNPFLCESTEQIPSNPISEPLNATVASLENPTISASESTPITAPLATPNAPAATDTPPTTHHNGNPFVESQSLSSRLLKIHNTTNPFTGLSQRVKGPHLLQKTISEDYLFRKLGVNSPMANGNGTGPGSGHVNGNGNGTWSFGRSLLRQDSTLSLGMGLGRRNSSQVSLDSHAGSVPGSMEGINLERAISCDSVTSDSTLFLDQLDQPYTQITGYLCVGLNYDQMSMSNEGMELTVSVLEAKGLICPFSVESLDTFVRIYLVPDHPGAMQTKVVKGTLTPNYNESFDFWLHKRQARHSLWFHLYHNGPAHTLIGEAEMEIGEMPRPITTWIPLSDSRKCNARWGELMFSLSYLPTAERLTIVVVKARNLKLDGEQPAPESAETVHSVFVKVYLMDKDRKVLKKRTSLKRKDRSPIFNESMIFSVPPPSLTTTQLRVTVFGVTASGVTPLGHIVAGSCAVGKGLRHWHQMLSSLRKPVAMWHVLRRAVNQPIFTGGAEAVVAAMQNTLQRSTAKRNSIV